jgi:ribonuclease HII
MPSRKSFKLEQLGPLWAQPGLLAGVDEAGRGPLAGPVMAAAVILDPSQPIKGLRDSKQMTARAREAMALEIKGKALCCCVASASAAEVDQLNILQATLLAMRRAVQGLRLLPHRVLVDGNRLPVLAMPMHALVKGDTLVAEISAASILAKTQRDEWCQALHLAYPDYGFDAHKGYPTAQHLDALARLGPCPDHRRSFAPVQRALLGRAGGAAADGAATVAKPG